MVEIDEENRSGRQDSAAPEAHPTQAPAEVHDTPQFIGIPRRAPGKRVGQYVLGELLGQGGMGRVYAAYDPILKREVALKLLGRDDPLLLVRFLQEAQYQARLTHPAICRVFEVGTEGDAPYIAMERIHGEDLLHTRLDRLLPEALTVMAEIAEAIHSAHEAGLIHRDIKPGNIMLARDHQGGWQPRVLDFGLARELESPGMTVGTGVLGTPAYMAPEQALGEPATALSDVYALGATFYAFLVGHPPFQAQSAPELLLKHRDEECPSLSQVKPEHSKELSLILQKCLEKEPARRYESAQALADDLRRLRAGEPILAKPPSLSFRMRRNARRQRAWYVGAAILTPVALLAAWGMKERHEARQHLAATQTYEQELRDIEARIRFARTAPLHDTRPEMAATRQRLQRLETRVAQEPGPRRGPGLAMLGQGYLGLRDYEQARIHLQLAWDLGEHSPRTAYALGRALAELYRERINKRMPGVPRPDDPALNGLQAELREPARRYLELGRAATSECPNYVSALLAHLDFRFDEAVTLAQAAQKEQPTFYESMLLEVDAWGQAVYLGPDCRTRLLNEAPSILELLARAESLARSDEEVQTRKLTILAAMETARSEQGRPSQEHFDRIFRTAETALSINPDSEPVKVAYAIALQRFGFFMLQRGRDPRPEMAKGRVRMPRPEETSSLATELRGFHIISHWLAAEYEWRHGLDPLPSLAKARVVTETLAPQTSRCNSIELLNLEAQIRSERGLEPSALHRKALDLSREDLQYSKATANDYGWDLLGEAHLAAAQHQVRHGLEARESVREAIAGLERCLSINPRMVYARISLVHARLAEAADLARRGADPAPALEAALREARRAMEVRPEYHRTLHALGEALLAEAEHGFEHGRDPSALLRELDTACTEGLKGHPGHFCFPSFQGRGRMLAARRAAKAGADPKALLDAADAFLAQACAWKKTDADAFRSAARAALLRAELLPATAAESKARARKLLRTGLSIHACDPASQALLKQLS